MKIVLFCHSLISDWNHGNAHFLRGIVSELLACGHRVDVYEPADAWSVQHLLAEQGRDAIRRFHRAYPHLISIRYDPRRLDLEPALHRADLVIVHEWNDPSLVAEVGRHRDSSGAYVLLFHDTHHRSVTRPGEMAAYDLRHYDGVLAFGDVVRRIYLTHGWARRAYVWHEAADTMVFHPRRTPRLEADAVWIGNWGDEERTEELDEFLLQPLSRLGLASTVHGVRYHADALSRLAQAGARYGGWLANFDVPAAFARHRLTVHVPRRPYVEALHGIPTIRPFEAMSCAIPLICSPWTDSEGLFRPGKDYRIACDTGEMTHHMRTLLDKPWQAQRQAADALETILARHTCRHRAEELVHICRDLGLEVDHRRTVIPTARAEGRGVSR